MDNGGERPEAMDANLEQDLAHNVVRLSQVTKLFRMGDNELLALKGINLAIKAGEYISIMGPSAPENPPC